MTQAGRRRWHPWAWLGGALLCVWMLTLLGSCGRTPDGPIVLWHAYRGAEADALLEVVQAYLAEHPEREVRMVAVPHEVYATKLTSGVPRGNGPDVFVAAHERVGDWARLGLLRPLRVEDAAVRRAEEGRAGRAGPWLLAQTVEQAAPNGAIALDQAPETHVAALRVNDALWGAPLAAKAIALWYRPDLLDAMGASPPTTTDEMIALAVRFGDRSEGRFGLAYEAGALYFHGPWMHGFGGGFFESEDAPPRIDTPENRAAWTFVAELQHEHGVLPQESTGALVLDLFGRGRALFVISGPWFLSDLGPSTPWGVVPLPIVSATGRPAAPWVTVEGAFVTTQVTDARMEAAAELVAWLSSEQSARIRATRARQIVSHDGILSEPAFASDPFLSAFREAAALGRPMPNRPEMNSLWEPGSAALRQVLRGSATPEDALSAAQHRIERVLAPAPQPAETGPWWIFLSLTLVGGAAWAVHRARTTRLLFRMRGTSTAWLYVGPALGAAMLLVVLPFTVGALLSLWAHHEGDFTFVGLANFVRILGTEEYAISDPYSFWFTLGVTVAWTGFNVFLHVTIGLTLALLLRDPWVRLRGLWRVLLIIPWAVPNYITALIWKGLFHVEFGSINALLGWFGVEPVDWFSRFATAFSANLATNVWLGFPFMMVVSLGALQSIPRSLEEAAEVDGASRWQVFRHVTLPLLVPALLPAVILGTVWTFNMFNIIYLVSGGEPDGTTEILISEAYRWAFSRQYQYGYAAAYGVLIFGVLVLWSRVTSRVQRRLA